MFKIRLIALLGLMGTLSSYGQAPDSTPTPPAKPTPAPTATPWPTVNPPGDPAKFDLILLVGQSNMAGRGKVEEADRQPDSRILTLNFMDDWCCQGQPIHFDKPIAGTGLGFAFAKLAADKNPGVTLGLIPCAVGGTSVRLWQPGQKLYQDAIKRTKLAMQSGKLKAILWHQGESDSNRADTAEGYGARLKTTLEGFRKDLDAPNVPIILGELGEFTFTKKDGTETFARSINDQIKAVAAELSNVTVVASRGLTDRGDSLHFSSEALREFGKRYFEAWQKSTPMH